MPRALFGPWLPDAAEFGTGASAQATNVLTAGPVDAVHYKPFQAPSAYSSTGLDTDALGAISVRDVSGDNHIFAGDNSDLYKLDASDLGFDKVSKSGGYNVTAGEFWWFLFWDGDKILAGSGNVAPQVYTLGSSSLFADLSGSPPQARHAAVIGPHIMLGSLNASPQTVQWSAAANETTWTTGGGPNGGTQAFQEGGWVQAIAGGRLFGYIFHETMIRRVIYTQDDSHFQFDIVVRDIGLSAPRSLTTNGFEHFFLANDGFKKFDGQSVAHIGRGAIDQYFFDNVDSTRTALTYGVVDPKDTKVYWAYYTGESTGNILVYDYYRNRWTEAQGTNVFFLSYTGTSGITLEQLDTLYPSDNMDTFSFSLDARFLQGELPDIGAFDASNKLAFFDGATLAATMDTGEAEPIMGRRSLIHNSRPLVFGNDASQATVALGSRERASDTVSFGSDISQEDNGDCPQEADSRYHRARVKMAAGTSWDEALGIDFEAVDSGEI